MARPGKILGFTGLGIALVILLALCGFGYFKYLWVFSDGTKTGELNSLTYTGYLFKTYEGEIILTGYGSNCGATADPHDRHARHRALQRVQRRPALARL